jgi:DNA/RNA-binding domain of Phe-tRNA-synthetase-like protein
MIVRCSPEFFDMFPEASIHGAIFDQVNFFSGEVAEIWKNQAQQSVRDSGTGPDPLIELSPIKEWREAFQIFGLKPSKYRSSIEQLFRRALKGDIIQTGLPLVNLYCYISLIQMVPMGGYDLRSVRGDISVRMATAGEEFTAIGARLPIKCDPGVVVYSDEAGIICWGWNHRDSARTCLDADSRTAIFFADSAFAESRYRAAGAIDLLTQALLSAGATRRGSFELNRQASEGMLHF